MEWSSEQGKCRRPAWRVEKPHSAGVHKSGSSCWSRDSNGERLFQRRGHWDWLFPEELRAHAGQRRPLCAVGLGWRLQWPHDKAPRRQEMNLRPDCEGVRSEVLFSTEGNHLSLHNQNCVVKTLLDRDGGWSGTWECWWQEVSSVALGPPRPGGKHPGQGGSLRIEISRDASNERSSECLLYYLFHYFIGTGLTCISFTNQKFEGKDKINLK